MITMDVYASILREKKYDWKTYLEIFVVCRRCHRSSIQLVSQIDSDRRVTSELEKRNGALSHNRSLNDIVSYERTITLKDQSIIICPEHIPENILGVLDEANRCLAASCYNAAASMFRLSIDLSTKALLPDDINEPAAKIRKNLGLRLIWLFNNSLLPSDLKPLAECIQQDGNDGAHDGTLSKADACDLQDFCFELFRRLYTEPEKLRIAMTRRQFRRSSPKGS